MAYDFPSIETRWQERWQARGAHAAPDGPARPYYCLEMFAYPSGDIHMGHFRNYSVGDVVARARRMQGYDVLHPFGWDAFGLPAEEAAIKRGIHPRDWTLDNIRTSRATLQRCGISYDWDREVTTCLPDYYRWNQWLFLKLHERGLAYLKSALVNWCPGCQTVLANEQVEGGRCWKCESEVTKRELEQWFVRTTAYAQRLLDGLDGLDGWPDDIKSMQRHWIGRSEGARVRFRTTEGEDLEVFTTRPDTLFGVSFVALAPEHPLVATLAERGGRATEVGEYVDAALKRTEIERTSTARVQDGVDTGATVVHPLTGNAVPVWVGDYVLMHYGTGAVMGVPGHDDRDFAFARRYDLPVRVVIRPEGAETVPDGDALEAAWTGPGSMIASGEFDGLDIEAGGARVAAALAGKDLGGPEITFRLHDWLISRQRFWGTPIPMIRCDACGVVPVPVEQLPVLLPEGVEDFHPKGRSPLADVPEFIDTQCPACGGAAKRDADTMDTFIDSSWYHLRYPDPHNDAAIFDPAKVKDWLPIDLYIGGREHATGHLIYFRFLTMVLHDEGLLDFEEPAVRMFNHGMVQDAEGKKMSKSKGNLVEPAEMLQRFGIDASRIAMCFFAPSHEPIVWNEQGVAGALRFLKRVVAYVDAAAAALRACPARRPAAGAALPDGLREARRLAHGALERMTHALDGDLAFNTVVSDLMKALKELEGLDAPDPAADSEVAAAWRDTVEVFVAVLAPMAPHLGEELHAALRGDTDGSVFDGPWPDVDPEALRRDEVELPVQVNGRVRDRLVVPADLPAAEVEARALALETLAPYLEGKTVRKLIVVPGKIVNIVVG